MRISSDMLCRANGKLYEQLTITDLPAGTTPAVAWPGDGPEAPLPCSLYEVDAATGAVRPCVPGAAAESVAAAASATPHAIRVHCFKNRSIFEQPPFSGQGSCRPALLLLSS